MKNKCVLVTGATKGIGWAISQHLSDLGAHVVGLARNTQDIDFPGYLYACDLSNAGESEEVLRMLREKYPVDAVVNNVGSVMPQPIGEVDLENLYRVFDLNVRSAVQVAQTFIPSMKARQEGRIINISSRAAHGAYDRTSYAAAKSALLGCTNTWALELAPYGITVNAISPGPTETALFRQNCTAGSDRELQLLQSIPMGRFAQADEIAAAVAFFLSNAASYITGQELLIDGGSSLIGR